MSHWVYWSEMREKAAEELVELTGKPYPHTECEVKAMVGCALRHGTPEEAGKVVCEAAEWLCSNLKVRKHEWIADMEGDKERHHEK